MARYRKKKESKLPKRADLKGKKIGELTVVSAVPNSRAWWCVCSCSTTMIKVQHNRLIDKNNPKTHCGCKRGGLPKQFKKEYHSWWDMIARCHNSEHPSYRNFGGKGLTVCSAWRSSFEFFLADMGQAPKDHILRLKAGETIYFREACEWVPKPKRVNKGGVQLVPHPITKVPTKISDIAKEYKMSYQQARYNLIKEGLIQK